MPRRAVEANNLIYQVSPDDPPVSGNRVWGLVRARVVDEMTGQPTNGSIRLETDLHSVSTIVASNGLVGLTGIPMQVFPGLKSKDYQVTLKVRAEGYVSQDVVFTIEKAKNSNFPVEFTPPLAVEVNLHHDPIVIAGRVMLQAADGTKSPLNGAIVRVTKIWRMPPSATLSPPPDPASLISLDPPLYADRRISGTATLIQQTFTEVSGEDKFLLEDYSAGTHKIRLSDRINLIPSPSGSLLLVDAGQADIAEYLVIDSINGGITQDQPATISLNYPLANFHRKNAVVRRVIPADTGVSIPIAYDAIAGDTCIFVTHLGALATDNPVKISKGEPPSGGAIPDEFHRVSLFSTVSGIDGYFRLPPLARVAQISLSAEQGALTPVTVEFRPNYSLRENWLDFDLR